MPMMPVTTISRFQRRTLVVALLFNVIYVTSGKRHDDYVKHENDVITSNVIDNDDDIKSNNNNKNCVERCSCGVVQGQAGSPGVPGVPGLHGSRGQDGHKGDKGSTGSRGELGPTGPVGASGPQGPPGEKGKQGKEGERGLTGETSEKGEKGERGYSGFAGVKGDRGLPSPPPHRVAFSVARSQKLGPVLQDTPVTFDVIVTNIGEGFETYSSHFVCRRNGTYLFTVHVLGQEGKDVYAWVMMNDRHRVPLHGDGRAGYGGGSQTVILTLRTDDHVWVQLSKDSALLNDYTTFSGYLLFED